MGIHLSRIVLVLGLIATVLTVVLFKKGHRAGADGDSWEAAETSTGFVAADAPVQRSSAPLVSTATGTQTSVESDSPAFVPAKHELLLHEWAQLQGVRQVLASTGTALGNLDARELRSAAMFACFAARNRVRDADGKDPAFRTAIEQYLADYCEGLELADYLAEQQLGLLQPEHDPDSHLARDGRAVDAAEASVPAAIDLLLERLNTTPFPHTARMLASALLNPKGPYVPGLRSAADLAQVQTHDVHAVSAAVGDLFACSNGPLCGPNAGYTWQECLLASNCRPGAGLLDIRRDLTTPQDWRLAQRIVAEIRSLRRSP